MLASNSRGEAHQRRPLSGEYLAGNTALKIQRNPNFMVNSKQSCPNCPSSSYRLVFKTHHGSRVVQCARCGLQFADTYPAYEKAASEIYGSAYFKGSIEKQEEREKVFTELLSEMESILKRKGRLLDIGAGDGTLLRIAAERGWEAEGTEIASVMIRFIREDLRLTVHQGMLEDIQLPTRSFDAVIMNHVLEHVRNPRTTLEKVTDLLSPGGFVRIEVPNLASLSSRAKNMLSRLKLKRNPWKHYSTGHHFWFFTPSTLKITLETAGLSPILMNAPAAQWGNKSFLDFLANILYERTLWGGHLVVYAGVP